MVVAKHGEVILPTKFEESRFFVEPVTLNGTKLRFFTDTAGGNFITSKAVQKAGLTTFDKIVGGENKKFAQAPEFREDTWIPPLVMNGEIMYPVYDPDLQIGWDGESDGMLGNNWFADRVWTFDYLEQKLILQTEGDFETRELDTGKYHTEKLHTRELHLELQTEELDTEEHQIEERQTEELDTEEHQIEELQTKELDTRKMDTVREDTGDRHRVKLGFQTDEHRKRRFHFPRIQATIDGETIDFLFDTGATLTLGEKGSEGLNKKGCKFIGTSFITESVYRRWINRHPEWRVIEHAEHVTGLPIIEAPEITISGFTVGPVWFTMRPDANFHNYMSQMMDRRVEGALGGSAFQYFRITVDYPRATAYFMR